MKTRLTILVWLLPLLALAQAPIWRNSWSTNQTPPVIGTNLWVSNTASGDGWFFYNQPNSNVVARLRDITNTVTGLAASTTNFNGIVVTNLAAVGNLTATGSITTSNGLFLQKATLIPTAASISNQAVLYVSNNVLFLEMTYDGTNKQTWAFKTNGITTFPGTLLAAGAALSLGAGGFSSMQIDTTALYPSVNLGRDLGYPSIPFRSIYVSNIFANAAIITNGNVGIGTNNPQAALHVWGSTSPYLMQLGGPAGGTNVASIATNGAATFAGNVTASSGTMLGNVIWSLGGIYYGPSGAARVKTYAPTNGAWKASDSLGTESSVSNGATLLLDPVQSRPFPAASKGVLTNGQWAVLNDVGGGLAFITSTNGTNVITPMNFKSNGAALFLMTKQMSNDPPNSFDGQPVGCYGAMMMPLTNILAIGPTAYTNINGYSVLNTNAFFCNTNTGTISNVYAGYYRITISAALLGANGTTLEGCFLTNGVDSECVSFYKAYDPGTARWDSMSASGLLYLPTNCQCSFGLKTSTAGNVAIRRASIVIGTP